MGNVHTTGNTCLSFRGIVGTGGVTKGHMVKIDSGTIVAATLGSDVAGIAVGTYASGEEGIFMYGPINVKFAAHTGVDFAHLDTVYPYSSNSVYAGAQGHKSCGRVVYDNPASAGTVTFVLQTPGLTDTVTHA